ncbi:28S rRNA (cytosine-C(5))-methyltransferase-like [Mercenaria mercenaria]|uniref:28S rRNA (cytosine-C(5))-methyltransferase-like n=1 Tax=Mercenaria mercenaria TaxID=6596 RepID=UPI00234E3FF0|nr:28S rRNA (cytosine-C(5))-methyltransferase-like [Mercenaria mercenaria]
MIPVATAVVADAVKKKGSLKNLVFSSKFKNKKALYALTCETLRYRKPLLEIAAECGVLKDKRLRNDDNLAAVLMYEHLLGKGVSGKYKVMLHKYKNAIHSRCERIKIEQGVTDLKQALQKLLPSHVADKPLPKYVRINTILGRKEYVMGELQKQFELREHLRSVSMTECDSGDWFIEDEHIPNLLMLPSSTQLHNHPLYLSGKVIIQDKASCFPAYILNPPSGSTVIDCCAAPGNKTTHLAAIMGNNGTIYAFDKDPKRLSTLKTLVAKAGATCVQAGCRDFLSVSPLDKMYENVEYILVDPSCSGSGMVNRQQQFTDEKESCTSERLQQLSKFQISILKHALNFPRVKKVVYSTCSIHDEENEMVVEEVYSQFCDKFEIESVMPAWKYRGKKIYKHGSQCLRMSYEDCQTNGFFVASFIKRSNELLVNDVPEHFNKRKEKMSKGEKDSSYLSTESKGIAEKILKKNRQRVCVRNNGFLRKHSDITEKNKTVRATTRWTVMK